MPAFQPPTPSLSQGAALAPGIVTGATANGTGGQPEPQAGHAGTLQSTDTSLGTAPASSPGTDPDASAPDFQRRSSQAGQHPDVALGRASMRSVGPGGAGPVLPAHPPGYGYGPQSSELIGPAAAEAIDLVMESVYELCACVPLSGKAGQTVPEKNYLQSDDDDDAFLCCPWFLGFQPCT